MELSLKLDDDGNVVVDDGKPVYVDQDGKDIAIDATSLYAKIAELGTEAKTHRKGKSTLKAELEKVTSLFEGIDDLEAWKLQAEKNAELVANFNDKDLVDAKKVEQIKKAQNEAHEEDKRNILKSFSLKEEEFQKELRDKDNTIYNLMVSSKFAQSPFFTGEKPKSILPPEIAEKYFGSNFRVEKDGNGLRVTGYIGDDPVYSRQNPGELAEFEEALESVIDAYPMKERIMRSSGGGSGASGGSGGGDTKTGIEAQLAKLRTQYKEAMDGRNSKLAIALKHRIFELEQKQQTTR